MNCIRRSLLLTHRLNIQSKTCYNTWQAAAVVTHFLLIIETVTTSMVK